MADPVDAVLDAELAGLLLQLVSERTIADQRQSPAWQRGGDLRPSGKQDVDAFLLDQASDGDDGRCGEGKGLARGLVGERIGQKGELLLGDERLQRVQRAL